MESQSDPDKRIKVLIIDDSALVRAMLTKILGADPALQVVGTAADAFIAREKIKVLNPDVLTLDVEMPRMDGLQFLRNLMRLRPMPVVMCSSLTERGADVTLAGLELGAMARVRPMFPRTPAPKQAGSALVARSELRFRTTDQIVAIGASTGGTEA